MRINHQNIGPYLVSKETKKLLQIIKIENNWIKIKFFIQVTQIQKC